MNPLITFATLLTGLTCLARAVSYMIAQLLGAALAGGLIRGTIGKVALDQKYNGGGCFFDHTAVDTVSVGQAFLIETMCTFVML